MIECENCILEKAVYACEVDCLALEDALREHDKQIRADAIDEILKSDLCEHDEDWDYPCITPSYLWERLTQLKEQNKS